jgi:hypothetical protein
MLLTIRDRVEKARLNGYRIPGQLYLVGTLVNYQCCKIPLELSKDIIPKLGLLPVPMSIKEKELPYHDCIAVPVCHQDSCAIFSQKKFCGMMWVNEKDYPGAAFFVSEARTQPIQMRIKHLSCNIQIGASWVLLAHRKAIVDYSDGAGGWINEETGQAETAIKYKPGMFTMFRVDAVEYLVTEKDLQGSAVKYLYDMQKGGVTLVKVTQETDLENQDYQESETETDKPDMGFNFLPGELYP